MGLLKNTEDHSLAGLVIEDFKNRVRDLIVSFVFVQRSANQPIHLLARSCGSISGFRGWWSTPPEIIVHALNYDMIKQLFLFKKK